MKAFAGLFAALALLAAAPAPAAARPASKGFFTEGGLGATGFLGSASDYSRVGVGLQARIGYDLFSWLSVGGHISASTHEATVPPPPEGEYYQLYGFAGDVRLGFRTGPVALFVEGGAGMALISSNVLSKVGVLEPGEELSLLIDAGGGAEYQLQNRHYAFGLGLDWMMLPQFDATMGLSGRLYLRYTY